MKIGLLTWWKTWNYGAMLQAFATFSYLRQLGHEVEMIDFRQPADRYPFMMGWRMWFPGKRAKLRFLLEYRALGALRRIRKSNKFVTHFFTRSKRLNTFSEIAARRYDLIVVGSDQLWNPLFMEDENDYFLSGLDDTVKRMSFSTSIASDVLPEKTREKMAVCLPKFSALSLREPTLIDEVKDLARQDVFWSVDPTLLLSASEWASYLGFRVKSENRNAPIVVYWLSDLSPHVDELIAIARHEKRTLRLYADLTSFRLNPGTRKRQVLKYLMMRCKLMFSRRLKVCMAASPADFIQDIAGAYGVVADSFHAMMFSIIFRKNVKIFVPESRKCMASRMTGFLDRIGLNDVLVRALSPRILEGASESRYEGTSKLDVWIAETKDWLKEAIDTTCRN